VSAIANCYFQLAGRPGTRVPARAPPVCLRRPRAPVDDPVCMVDGSGGYGRHAATGLVEINPVCVYVRLCNRPDYKLANPPASCEAGNSTAPTVAGCIPGCKQFDHPFVQAQVRSTCHKRRRSRMLARARRWRPLSAGVAHASHVRAGGAQGMFIGEMLCLLAFKIGLLCSAAPRRPADRPDESSYSPFIFALPALCDCLGTSTMYLGLTMTVRPHAAAPSTPRRARQLQRLPLRRCVSLTQRAAHTGSTRPSFRCCAGAWLSSRASSRWSSSSEDCASITGWACCSCAQARSSWAAAPSPPRRRKTTAVTLPFSPPATPSSATS